MVVDYIIRVLTGPSLLWTPQHLEDARGQLTSIGAYYRPNVCEKYSQMFLSLVRVCGQLFLYCSPFFSTWIFRRLDMYRQNPRHFCELCFLFSITYCVALVIRTYGRLSNPHYTQFIEILKKASQNFDYETKEMLSKFDFDFTAWPVEFIATSSRPRVRLPPPNFTFFEKIVYFPHRVLGWVLINTFGLKLIYPGSTRWLLQNAVANILTENRALLMHSKGGERFKVVTVDHNDIDTIFFDRRNKQTNGSTLVICCEGNAGFYEIGMIQAPLESGYSVIGWNIPGFAGSTGSPMPRQIENAIDSIMQFAIQKLDFDESDIIVYGWSIGGYPASWVGMNYPKIRGLILDATFDDLVPLAVNKMPDFAESLVRTAIRDNVNLDVARQLVQFNGPIRLIRRTGDEMISTNDNEKTVTNRGNCLLLHLLRHRFPHLTSEESKSIIIDFLSKESKSAREEFINARNISESNVEDVLHSSPKVDDDDVTVYPSNVGKELSNQEKANFYLYLASQYMTEFDSNHCTQLPKDLFKEPWSMRKL